MLPSDLLDTVTPEEVADLLTYVRSGGHTQHDVYRESWRIPPRAILAPSAIQLPPRLGEFFVN